MLLTIATLALFGVLLMMLETFLPGWVAGILGFVCLVTALILTLSSEELSDWSSWARTGLAAGIILFAVVSLLLWMKYFAVKFWNRTLTLTTQIESPNTSHRPALDSVGVAISDLHPLGRAEIGGKRWEVRCEDGFAPAKAEIRVTGSEPGNLIVRVVS
jgi:membrane-bound serine protease (ClpP class)